MKKPHFIIRYKIQTLIVSKYCYYFLTYHYGSFCRGNNTYIQYTSIGNFIVIIYFVVYYINTQIIN